MSEIQARRVTLDELAGEAGVSIATVSKVLNGRADVAASTRQRVEDLLDHHGYERRHGLGGRSSLIELVFPELQTAWAMEIIRGVENVAPSTGHPNMSGLKDGKCYG